MPVPCIKLLLVDLGIVSLVIGTRLQTSGTRVISTCLLCFAFVFLLVERYEKLPKKCLVAVGCMPGQSKDFDSDRQVSRLVLLEDSYGFSKGKRSIEIDNRNGSLIDPDAHCTRVRMPYKHKGECPNAPYYKLSRGSVPDQSVNSISHQILPVKSVERSDLKYP